MQEANKRRSVHSIYFQLLLLLIFSAAAAAVLFQGMDIGGSYLIDRCIYNTEYLEKRGEKYAEGIPGF